MWVSHAYSHPLPSLPPKGANLTLRRCRPIPPLLSNSILSNPQVQLSLACRAVPQTNCIPPIADCRSCLLKGVERRCRVASPTNGAL